MNIIDKKTFNDVFNEVSNQSNLKQNIDLDRTLKQLISTPLKHMCSDPKFSDCDYLDELINRCFELSENDNNELSELRGRIYHIVKNNKIVDFGGVF